MEVVSGVFGVFGVLVLILLVMIIFYLQKPTLSGTWKDNEMSITIKKIFADTYRVNDVDYKLIRVGEDSVLYDAATHNSIPFKFKDNALILGFGTTSQYILKK
jgi:hypothetical protein